jgi:hypothetical protein
MKDDTRTTHESYGTVQFSRRSGDRHLFGSAIEDHHQYVTLTISQAEVVQSDDTLSEHVHPLLHQPVVQVSMSEAQFARAITSFGIGTGVPVTIDRIGHQQLEGPPRSPASVRRVGEQAHRDIGSTRDTIGAMIAGIGDKLTVAKVSKKRHTEIMNELRGVARKLTGLADWVGEVVDEEVERGISTAAIEIDAMVTAARKQMGEAAVAQLQGQRARSDVFFAIDVSDEKPE